MAKPKFCGQPPNGRFREAKGIEILRVCLLQSLRALASLTRSPAYPCLAKRNVYFTFVLCISCQNSKRSALITEQFRRIRSRLYQRQRRSRGFRSIVLHYLHDSTRTELLVSHCVQSRFSSRRGTELLVSHCVQMRFSQQVRCL